MFRLPVPMAAVLAVCLAAPLHAGDLPTPEGAVLLTVTGAIDRTNAEGAALFDLEMLEEFGGTEITTTTIWTEGEKQFEGVSLHRLIDELGIEAETLKATAINDYAVEIPIEDAVEGGPILAYRMNGDTMSVRDKGPLWIVYPYDSNAAYRSEVIYSRSIWQLDRIEAVE
ncbi:molybdopterin-dependent oxidoreductase [Pseudooceanicola aestuarii]|uniref:molybdopterin-dependent oxidoreductase n=1 Tax=Pseudooceanicola aestuarii TaxID=2697319 RepID=UPI0013D7785A|nr:molybdopterin-dependent oxidoreductase [Pseudooceanicola aestuarii]